MTTKPRGDGTDRDAFAAGFRAALDFARDARRCRETPTEAIARDYVRWWVTPPDVGFTDDPDVG